MTGMLYSAYIVDATATLETKVELLHKNQTGRAPSDMASSRLQGREDEEQQTVAYRVARYLIEIGFDSVQILSTIPAELYQSNLEQPSLLVFLPPEESSSPRDSGFTPTSPFTNAVPRNALVHIVTLGPTFTLAALRSYKQSLARLQAMYADEEFEGLREGGVDVADREAAAKIALGKHQEVWLGAGPGTPSKEFEFMIDKYTPHKSHPEVNAKRDLDAIHDLMPRHMSLLHSWDFPALSLDADGLSVTAFLILEHVMNLEGCERYRICSERLWTFVRNVERGYWEGNAYHNWTHAVDVLQGVFHFVRNAGWIGDISGYEQDPNSEWEARGGTGEPLVKLTHCDVLALCIAAIGHDLGHPGLNNNFLINACAPIALLYNDRSVLENFHCCALREFLRRHWMEVLVPEIRIRIFEAVLSTDMALHFDYVGRINQLSTPGMGTDAEGAKRRGLICAALLKCADISNVARPYELSREWSRVLIDEFAAQSQTEQKLGLPPAVPPPATNVQAQSKGQVGFIDLFALPLFRTVAGVLPSMGYYVERMVRNRETWAVAGGMQPSPMSLPIPLGAPVQSPPPPAQHVPQTPPPPPTMSPPAAVATAARGSSRASSLEEKPIPPPKPLPTTAMPQVPVAVVSPGTNGRTTPPSQALGPPGSSSDGNSSPSLRQAVSTPNFARTDSSSPREEGTGTGEKRWKQKLTFWKKGKE
ncbi:3',5'-cyclic-nucleotide phosphodiesterase [Saitoella coloradoensis]